MDKEFAQIILMVYIALASTLGAWWLASNDIYKKEITLLDVVGNIIPSVLFIWLFYPIYVLTNIRIKRMHEFRKPKKKKK